jgi:hypothetical protein
MYNIFCTNKAHLHVIEYLNKQNINILVNKTPINLCTQSYLLIFMLHLVF